MLESTQAVSHRASQSFVIVTRLLYSSFLGLVALEKSGKANKKDECRIPKRSTIALDSNAVQPSFDYFSHRISRTKTKLIYYHITKLLLLLLL